MELSWSHGWVEGLSGMGLKAIGNLLGDKSRGVTSGVDGLVWLVV